MPTVKLQNCVVTGDLAQGLLDFREELGDRTRALVNDVQAIEFDVSDLTSLNDLLTTFNQQGSNPPSEQEIQEQTGIPPIDPDDITNEERIELLGLVVIKKIGYLPDGSGNIDAFRRLYFAVGADRTRFLEFVQGTNPLLVTQTQLRVVKLPLRSTWTVEDARDVLNNAAIEAVYVAGDGSTYCVVPSFLGVNESREQVSVRTGIPENQIMTQVFWLRGVAQDPGTLNRLSSLGIRSDELSAALAGERLIEVRPQAATSATTNATIKTAGAINTLKLILSRFNKLDAASKASLKEQGLNDLTAARDSWFITEQKNRFYATVITRPEDISDFLTRNQPQDIDYMLGSRVTVTGINFQVSRDEIRRRINQIVNISAGSTTMSSLAVAKQRPRVDSSIDTSNSNLIKNECALRQLTGNSYSHIETALACLTAETAAVSTTPEISNSLGYPTYDSPASLLFNFLDINLTLDIDTLLSKLGVNNPFDDPVYQQVMASIVDGIKSARQSISRITGLFITKVMDPLRNLQNTLSRFTAFAGTANIDSSVLKCSLGFNLNANLPIFDELASLLNSIRRKLRNAIAKALRALLDLVEKILCMPLNFINGFLNKSMAALPSFCKVMPVQFPKEVDDILNELRGTFAMEQGMTKAFARDTLRLGAAVQSMPSRLNNYRKSASCQPPAVGALASSMVAQLQFGAGEATTSALGLNPGLANPTGFVANTLSNFTPGL